MTKLKIDIMELKGKTILITGGASGIGLESARQFLANGAKVIITGRDRAKLDAAKKRYPALTAIQSDVANPEDAQSLFDQMKALGGIDILYNNAGVMNSGMNFGTTDAQHLKAAENEININYLGVIRLNDLFMEMLKSRKEGAIINTTSILSYVPLNLAPTYSATKVALRFYTESLRSHLQALHTKVKVFELLPPLVATSMTEGFHVKAIPPEKLVNALIAGIKKDKFTIRVGQTKLLYVFSRFFPKQAFKMLNPVKNARLLQA